MIDRNGYPDGGTAIVAAFTAALGDTAKTAAGRLVFFDLREANARALAGLSAEEREQRRREALDRPLVRWLDGFFPPEQGPEGPFRWCSGDCWIEISNPAAREVRVILSMRLSVPEPPASVRVRGDVWTETIALPPGGAQIARTLTVRPGRHPFHLQCDGAPAISARDPRRLVLRVDDAHLRPAPSP